MERRISDFQLTAYNDVMNLMLFHYVRFSATPVHRTNDIKAIDYQQVFEAALRA